MKQLKMTLWMLLCILTMTACGGDDEPTPDPDKPSAEDLARKQGAVPAADLIGKTLEGPSKDGRFAHEITFVDATHYKTDTYDAVQNALIQEEGTYKLRITDKYTYIDASWKFRDEDVPSYINNCRLSYNWKDGKPDKLIVVMNDGGALLFFK